MESKTPMLAPDNMEWGDLTLKQMAVYCPGNCLCCPVSMVHNPECKVYPTFPRCGLYELHPCKWERISHYARWREVDGAPSVKWNEYLDCGLQALIYEEGTEDLLCTGEDLAESESMRGLVIPMREDLLPGYQGEKKTLGDLTLKQVCAWCKVQECNSCPFAIEIETATWGNRVYRYHCGLHEYEPKDWKEIAYGNRSALDVPLEDIRELIAFNASLTPDQESLRVPIPDTD